MRKHFLLLFLMALLPLAGWALDFDQSKFYINNIDYGNGGSDALPAVQVTDDAYTEGAANDFIVEAGTYYQGDGETKTLVATSIKQAGSGKYWRKVIGQNTYSGQNFYVSFWIVGIDIDGATVATISAFNYDGNAKTPKPAVSYDDNPLVEGVHFTYSYDKNVAAGVNTAKVIINGMNNYSGTKEVTFTINKANIPAANVTAPKAIAGLEYTAEAQTLVQDGTVTGLVAGNVVTFQYSNDDGENWYAANANEIKQTAAGNDYALTWKVKGNSNYNDYVPEENTLTGVIEKAMLVARAEKIETFYGNEALDADDIEISYEDFLGEDDAAHVFTGGYVAPTKSFATAVTTAEFAANTYPEGLVLTGGTAANYEVITVNGELKINPAKIKLTLLKNKAAEFGTAASHVNSWPLTINDIDDDANETDYTDEFKLEVQTGATTYTQIKVADDVKNYLTVVEDGDDAGLITGLTIEAAGNTAGAVGPYDLTIVGGTAANGNYTIDLRDGNGKKLTISAAVLTIKASNKVKTYGQADPTFTYTVTAGDATVITDDMDTTIKAALRRAQQGENAGNYTIDFGETEPSFTGYDINWEPGKLVIQKATLTITAQEQTLYTGNKEGDLDQNKYSIVGLVTNANAAAGTNINDAAVVTLAFNEGVAVSNVEGHEGELTVGGPYNEGIKVNLSNQAALAANYKITLTKGKLTVIDLTETLLLAMDADNNAAIAAADGTEVNVRFGAGRELKRETWAVMTLPFATTVTEVSAALGYAVVDLLDKDADDGNLHLKLHMGAINANQPFLVKYYRDDVPATYYTAEEAAEHNAGLDDAVDENDIKGYVETQDDVVEADKTYYQLTGTGYEEAEGLIEGEELNGVYFEAVKYTPEEAAEYNAGLDDAVDEGDEKTAAIDYATLALKDVDLFNGKEIVKDATDEVDAAGNQFFGVYAVTPVWGHEYAAPRKSTGAIERLGLATEDNPVNILPTAGYFQCVTGARIFIEEPDGSTTVIEGITADGKMIPAEGWYTLNGVKLQGMPTEKGVYINNGKKIVVK